MADEALHVTLVFLGWKAPERVGTVWEEASAGASTLRAPLLTPDGLVAVPPRRPRLFALELADEDGRAAGLHAALADALSRAGLHERERRPFWPHVTLARVRRGARPAPLRADPPPSEAFTAGVLTLYRSDLSPAGAAYTALERLSLSS